MKGPDLTSSLVAVLLRFRKWLVPVTADVEAMFHQIYVSPPDRDALRFYWWPDGNIDIKPAVYRMAVHLFRAKCSASCAMYCLRETAKQFDKNFDPKVAETILKSFYVDDCLTGADSEETAIDLIKNLRALLALGGFKLTKWFSSSDRVMSSVPEEKKSKAARSNLPSVARQQRVLKISWNTAADEFFFTADLPNFPITKRGMLAATNSLYDPLGFLAPVVLLARL